MTRTPCGWYATQGREQSAESDLKNTTLSAINRGGIATLADGSCWFISSSELPMAKDWRIGAEVMIEDHKLINAETGIGVRVVRIPLSG
jgi:hypothetical protein